MQRIDHLLPCASLGSERRLSVFRYGAGPRKAYIQASLHADELPGMRTAWELKLRLAALEAEGRLLGTVELVPVANPIGLDQWLQASHLGRFEANSGQNFNRGFVDLASLVEPRIAGQLGADAEANVQLIRQHMREVLDALAPATSGGVADESPTDAQAKAAAISRLVAPGLQAPRRPARLEYSAPTIDGV